MCSTFFYLLGQEVCGFGKLVVITIPYGSKFFETMIGNVYTMVRKRRIIINGVSSQESRS